MHQNIYEASKKVYEKARKGKMIRIAKEDMLQISDNGIDYAMMEKSKGVKVIPSDIGWSNVGSFDALAKELPNDKHNKKFNGTMVKLNDLSKLHALG